MSEPSPSHLAWLAVASVLLTLWLVAGPVVAVTLLVWATLFAVPGFLVVARLLEPWDRLETIALGSILGIGASSAVVACAGWVLGEFTVWRPMLLLCALGVSLTAICGKIARHRWVRSGSGFDRTLSWLLIVTAATLLVPYVAFASQRQEFRGLQLTDLLHHLATTVELGKGIPPQNPYFLGERLHYYWLAHVLPSVVYSTVAATSSASRVLMGTMVVYSTLFVIALYVTVRAWFARPWVTPVLMVLGLFASGYTYLLLPLVWIIGMLPDSGLKAFIGQSLLTDTWGESYTGFSHGWFRLLLVEPHGTLAFSSLLAAVRVMALHGSFPRRLPVALILGCFVCLPLAMDSFLGLLFVASWLLCGAWELYRSRDRSVLLPFGTVLGVSAIAVGAMIALQMVVLGRSNLTFHPYLAMIAVLPFYFVADMGVPAVLGPFGLREALCGQGPREARRFMIVLGTLSILVMYFLRSPDVGTVVFRKAGTVLRLPLLFFTGAYLARFRASEGFGSRRAIVVAAAVLLALPTPWVDGLRLAGILPDGTRPVVVTEEDSRAYAWMREHLPPNAIVQELPSRISAIPSFAERRTALGEWIKATNFAVEQSRVAARHQDIYEGIFRSNDPQRAIEAIRRNGIQYLYLGEAAALSLAPDAVAKFDQIPELARIYTSGRAVLYHCERPRGTP